ncbi:hypothetical protein [Pseudoalteromonas sp. BDTF-M6]|uniref:hypothetical protein n=1 Tax=Pseudoalteromonas sp. BDTF-M6 TaxID=2796132 RepID=UPI001BAE6750|nr:hypothetical protein [Pseudoalteromonas sp. BDTF-M6]MBS3796700.1 hypothetical protein [Pseudoalteromonas sp. BDTF-M6]
MTILSEQELQEIKDLSARKSEIETRLAELKDKEKDHHMSTYVGRCFKYRNSFSVPENEEDHWDLYYYVYGQLDDGQITAIQFEKRKDNSIEIRFVSWYQSMTLRDCDEIPYEQLCQALDELKEIVQSINLESVPDFVDFHYYEG